MVTLHSSRNSLSPANGLSKLYNHSDLNKKRCTDSLDVTLLSRHDDPPNIGEGVGGHWVGTASWFGVEASSSKIGPVRAQCIGRSLLSTVLAGLRRKVRSQCKGERDTHRTFQIFGNQEPLCESRGSVGWRMLDTDLLGFVRQLESTDSNGISSGD